ncbi:MAG: LamG domain-containing protein [Planctomycetes bacterium]|nr:LamG domain-containing protein [Planctomycetota bacterium]MCB9892110.1 LamG domain-containing protein [Planctomycetota bacterium]
MSMNPARHVPYLAHSTHQAARLGFTPRLWLPVLLALSSVTIAPAQTAGNMMTFDGQDDRVLIPHSPALGITGDFTLEVWIKIPTQNYSWSLSAILAKGLDNLTCRTNYKIMVEQSTGFLVFSIGDGSCSTSTSGYQSLPGTQDLRVNQWIHLAAVRTSTSLIIYHNGQQDAIAPRTLDQYSNAGPLTLGNMNSAYPRHHLLGAMDEVRIWNIARTPQEIARHMNCVIDDQTPGLVAHYTFDEALGSQQVLDGTSNHHDGVLGDTTQVEVTDPVRSSSTLPLGPYARQYFGQGNLLGLGWVPTPSATNGMMITLGRPGSLAMLFVSLQSAQVLLNPWTILVDLGPSSLVLTNPFVYSPHGDFAFPLNLSNGALGGYTLFAQVAALSGGNLDLSNGLEIRFCF